MECYPIEISLKVRLNDKQSLKAFVAIVVIVLCFDCVLSQQKKNCYSID